MQVLMLRLSCDYILIMLKGLPHLTSGHVPLVDEGHQAVQLLVAKTETVGPTSETVQKIHITISSDEKTVNQACLSGSVLICITHYLYALHLWQGTGPGQGQ